MTEEFQALQSNETWSLAPRPQHKISYTTNGSSVLSKGQDGSVERFKARLVAKGFEQKCGLDYTETFSLVIKPSTIRVLLSLAVRFEWTIRQFDLSSAFLHIWEVG